MPVAYPSSLPTVLASKRISKVAPFRMSNPRRGLPYAEASGADTPTFFDVEWLLLPDDAVTLRDWVENDLEGGLLEFTMPLRTEDGVRLVTGRFLPDQLLDRQRVGTLWRYQASIVAQDGRGEPDTVTDPFEVFYVFPKLSSTDAGYPAVGSLHPYAFNGGPFGFAARLQIGTTFSSGADDRFVVDGVDRWTALPTLEKLRPGATIVDYLPKDTPFTVALRNLADVESGGQIAVQVTPVDEPTPVDASRSLVVLHARAGLVNGSVNIFDDTTRGIRAVVSVGTTVSTSVTAYAGESSIAFSGSGSEVNFDTATALDTGASDFTIEALVRRTSMTGEVVPFARLSASGSASGLAFYIPADGSGYAGAWTSTGTLIAGISIPAGTFTAGQWYYIGWRRSGTSWQVAVGTTPGGATTVYSTTGSGTVGGTGRPFTLGRDPGTVPKRLTGHIQELRYTVGLARSISTVPSAPFPRR